jgi:hypothetical protein
MMGVCIDFGTPPFDSYDSICVNLCESVVNEVPLRSGSSGGFGSDLGTTSKLGLKPAATEASQPPINADSDDERLH